MEGGPAGPDPVRAVRVHTGDLVDLITFERAGGRHGLCCLKLLGNYLALWLELCLKLCLKPFATTF